jgi:RHS repeat-associated protein
VANSAVPAGDFGPNWHHGWETKLQSFMEFGANKSTDNTSMIWVDEKGNAWFFRLQDGQFIPPAEFNGSLTRVDGHFELIKQDRTKLFFAGEQDHLRPFGALFRVESPEGEAATLDYVDFRLASVTVPFAGTMSFTRNAAGRVITVTRQRDNLSYHYTYDGNGKLASVTDFAGRTYHYTYNLSQPGKKAQGMLAGITDPLGRTVSFTYYDNGKAHEQFEPGGGVRVFRYHQGMTEVRDVDGFVTKHYYDQNLRSTKIIFPDGSKKLNRFDGNGMLAASTTELGGTTRITYDQNGNMSSLQRPMDPGPVLFTYHPNFNKLTRVQPVVGAATDFTLDENTGHLLGASRGSLSLSYTRDAFGNLLSTHNGRATYTDVRDANGLLTEKFDAHNPEARTHDSRGRVITRTFFSGRVLQYSYDDDDRVVEIQDSHGPNVANVFDAMGKLLQRTVTDGNTSQVTAFVYDERDRLVAETDAMGRTTSYIYHPTILSDKPIAVTDPAGRTTEYSYDRMHRLVKKTEPNGAETKFTYDLLGQLTSVTDANGNRTVYAYDLNGRKIRETRPSVVGTTAVNRVTNYFYDAADRLVREEMPSVSGGARRVTEYTYDELDRLVRRVMKRGSVVEDDTSYSYEPQLDATRLTGAVNGVAALGFTNLAIPPFSLSAYGVNSAVSGNPLGLIEGEFTLARGSSGEITEVSDANGQIFSKTYDAAGRLTGATASPFAVAISYDGFGRRSGVQFGSGETQSIVYDLLNRVTNLSWTGPVPVSQSLTYDQAGNITHLARENGSYTLGYDVVDQLVSSVSSGSGSFLPYNRSFQYDLLGNRLNDSQNGLGSHVSNFLLASGVSSFTPNPDGSGEVVEESSAEGSKSYSYRADGKISSFQSANVSVSYYYDGLDRLVAKAINDGSAYTQSFTHLGYEFRVLQGKAGDDSVTTYIDGQGMAERLGEVKGGVAKAYVTDHLGSVLNSPIAGEAKSFGLFGEISEPTAISSSSSPITYGFTGHMVDLESGLNRTEFRQYDSRAGRWLNQDPIGIKGGINLYGYARNRPVTLKDTDGRTPFHIPVVACVVAAGLYKAYTESNIRACKNKIKKDELDIAEKEKYCERQKFNPVADPNKIEPGDLDQTPFETDTEKVDPNEGSNDANRNILL